VRLRTDLITLQEHSQSSIDESIGPGRRAMMHQAFWNDWYSGWGWFLWLGFIFLLFSGIGNWGYTYRAHRRLGGTPSGDAFDILDARYAKGEIDRDEYTRMKSEISTRN
jgi:putative membrane protein